MMAGMLPSMTFTQKQIEVRTFAVRLRSNLRRASARAIRSGEWREYHGTKRPRRDDEIAIAWLLRAAKRQGATPVGDPKWDYRMDDKGEGATQVAQVRAVEPRTDSERRLFDGMRVREGTHWVNYFDPDDAPRLTAV